jgi:hypothetical protein
MLSRMQPSKSTILIPSLTVTLDAIDVPHASLYSGFVLLAGSLLCMSTIFLHAPAHNTPPPAVHSDGARIAYLEQAVTVDEAKLSVSLCAACSPPLMLVSPFADAASCCLRSKAPRALPT